MKTDRKDVKEFREHKAKLDGEVNRLWRASTNAEGIVDREVVFADLLAYLQGHPELADMERIARDAVNRADDRFRARFDDQLAMFEPDAYMVTGENERVLMEKASLEHLNLWGVIQTTEHAAQVTKYAKKIDWKAKREAKWGNHKTLGEVERAEFGWKPKKPS